MQALSSCFSGFHLLLGMNFCPLIPPDTMCVSFFFFFKFFYLCCTGSLLLFTSFLWLQEQRLLSSCHARPSCYSGSSCCTDSRAHRLGNSDAWLHCHGVRNLPRPGIEPVSPALAGGFLTPRPPGEVQPCSSLVRSSVWNSRRVFLAVPWILPPGISPLSQI